MRAKIVLPSPESLAEAVDALQRSEVIGMPTETVYGLAGNAFDPSALARIYEVKDRPTFDPLIVHVGPMGRGVFALARIGLIDLKKLTGAAFDRAERLMAAFWPGPLTLVLPKTDRVPDLATAGLPTVAVRMPRHAAAQALISLAGSPLAAPSANRFGRVSPTTAQAVAAELGDRIDLILDGGPCEVGLESTVVAVESDGTLRLLRPGGISPEELENAAGCPVVRGAPVHGAAAPSPGMLESHYAPSMPVVLLPGPFGSCADRELRELAAKGEHVGLLLLAGARDPARERLESVTGAKVTAHNLSATGELRDIARGLFAGLRTLEQSGCVRIIAEPCAEEHGLGHAIADRLRRASARREPSR